MFCLFFFDAPLKICVQAQRFTRPSPDASTCLNLGLALIPFCGLHYHCLYSVICWKGVPNLILSWLNYSRFCFMVSIFLKNSVKKFFSYLKSWKYSPIIFFWIVLFNRTFCSDRTILQLCCTIWQPIWCRYWALEMWPVFLMYWILNFIYF